MGYTTEQLEQLPFADWYGVLESLFVDAHTTALWPTAKVLDWLQDELPRVWADTYPDPERHGMDEAQQAAARRAEDMYGAGR